MRKLSFLPPAVLALGVVGAIIRYVELKTGFEPVGGLPVRGDIMTLLLAVLSVAALMIAVAAALVVGRRHATPPSFGKAFRTHGYISFALSALCGAASLVGAGMCLSTLDLLDLHGIPRYVFIGFAILSGVSIFVMATAAYTGKSGPLLLFTSLIPPIFFTYTLACLYRVNAGNPILLEYCFGCVAVGAAALALLYEAGCAYGRDTARGTVFAGLAAIFFLTVTLVDDYPVALRVIIAAADIFITQQTTRAISALVEKAPFDGMDEDKK